METVLKFDRVVLMKELDEKFTKVGEVFEIANILNDDAFLLRDARTKIAIGVVSFEDFESHFIKEENFKGWTNWTPLTGFDGQTDAVYRTNGKKVQCRFLTNKVRAEASCNVMDDFNLFFGIKLSYLRCLNKALDKKKTECEKMLNMVNCEIIDNERIMEKMVNSLKN